MLSQIGKNHQPPSALSVRFRNGDFIAKSGKVYKVPVVEDLLTDCRMINFITAWHASVEKVII